MMEEFKKVNLDLTGRHITLDMLIEVIKDYADLSQYLNIAGAENNFLVEGMLRISSAEDVKRLGETLVKVTNGGDFHLLGRTSYRFLAGMMDFIIECRGADSEVQNPGWYYVTSRFTEDGFENSEELFDFPLE